MTPRDFATGLMRVAVDENVRIYRELFESIQLREATDPYWQRALPLFSSLSEDEREVFFEVVRQVAVDTISHVLGILDGSSTFEGKDDEFTLTYGHDQRLDGDLQDLFLEEDEKVRNGR